MLSYFLPLALLVAPVAAFIECNVLDYGAVADNSTDLGPAILAAWKDCVIPQATTVATDVLLYVPSGNFLLNSNAVMDDAENFNMHIAGDIFLPFNPNLTGTMIEFDNCNNILFNGPGAIYGNGYRYREDNNLTLYPNRPRLLRFQNCNNVELTEIRLYDAPMFHVTVIGNNNLIHDMAIIATHVGETDGFDISGNNNYVHDVTVENGDECVTVKTPTDGFVAKNITCRWTAGCNIGSFGSANEDVAVNNVTYTNVSLSNSDAGVLIKSYPNCAGYVTNVKYNSFTLDTVAYPIDIDVFWAGDGSDTGTLSITDITFNDFTGTGTPTRPAVLLDCNSASHCESIAFESIDITDAKANSFTNACGSGLSSLSSC